MLSHFGITGIGFFGAVIYTIIPLILLYLIIRLAVRHGIESSDVANMLRRKMQAEQNKTNSDENDPKT